MIASAFLSAAVMAAPMEEMDMGKYVWPVPGERRLTGWFGTRRHPVTGEAGSFHNGVDVAAPQGSAVLAPCAGRVASVWTDQLHGGGLSMVFEGEDGSRFGFAHLSAAVLPKGAVVAAGTRLALTGGTPGTIGAGRSTGPHLHLTCKGPDGRLCDPMKLRWDWGAEGDR